MPKWFYGALRIVSSIVLGLVVAVVLTVFFGGHSLVLRAFFLIHGTTSPFAVLEQSVPYGRRIYYGSDPLQFGELLIPEGQGEFPVAIMVHGGCWSADLGPLPKAAVSLDLMRPLSAALARADIATWNVEYRRLGNAGGGWPGTYQDIAKAADYLRDLAPKRLDLTKVVAVGHSSGGQLALWLAARPKLPKDSALYSDSPLPLVAAVDLDGPPDLKAFKALDQEVCDGAVVQQFLGGSSDQFPGRYREGSSAGMLPIGVRQELLYSTKMEFISSHEQDWAALFKSYAAIATRAGDPVRLTVLENAGHFDGLNPHSTAGKTVVNLVEAVLSPSSIPF